MRRILVLSLITLSASFMLKAEEGLLLHWTFDEGEGAKYANLLTEQYAAKLADGHTGLCTDMPGVFGKAVHLSGSHALRTVGLGLFEDLDQITLSAWVLPEKLEGYNEIFRKEDGNNRVLFSFQASGAILSLGLNIRGYVECDARVPREQLLAGQWSHCAATFDGSTMRVYLNGCPVGMLKREGSIRAGGMAPACIGSANGNECFQGAIDDLKIYDKALRAEEIAALYSQGVDKINPLSETEKATLAALHCDQEDFNAVLSCIRKKIYQDKIVLSPAMAVVLAAKVGARFPNECVDFLHDTQMPVSAYLTDGDPQLNATLSKALRDRIFEYMPLTEMQRQHATKAMRQDWTEKEAMQARFAALESQGEEGAFAVEWLNLFQEAADLVVERPRIQEPVAPYIKPETPETRSLSAAEAQKVLERDWLFQADNKPGRVRIRQELAWTKALAERIAADWPGKVDFQEELASLENYADQIRRDRAVDETLYFQIRAVKRRILFKNPAVDFNKVLFVDMPYPAGSEWRHETRHRLGYMAVPGARLLTLEGLSPEGKLAQLMPQAPLHGSFWRPDLSFDGQRVLFCFKPHNEKAFHLYEINIDGTGLRQITGGPYDDLDPIYLPDGKHIIFSSTRSNTYVRCMPPTSAFVLSRCDLSGDNIYLISRSNEPDYLSAMLSDGRVIFTRWEYTDKPLWRAQSLWTLHPDGTQVNTLWGNQSVWPDLLKDARPIPNSHRIMFTGSAHHNWFAGSVGIIDPTRGMNFPDGLSKVTADVIWPESGNGPSDPIESLDYHVSGDYKAYYSPYPLSEKDFLVSAEREGKFLLYLMDVDGNRELIYEGAHNILHALPVKARTRPPVIQDQVAWPKPEERLQPKGGVIYSTNVYQGAPAALKDKAKFLRVLSIEHKTYTYWHKRPYLSTGPVVSGVQSEGVKRILGTVPIEADGSVSFEAPTGFALHFQLLDENYRALQTMRSFTGVMPGERRGCLGCHARHSATPISAGLSQAVFKRAPSPITPPPWGEDSISWERYVRPTLDQYCGKCHQGEGKARDKVDFTFRPGFLGFDETYWLFTGRPAWGKAYEHPEETPPGYGIADMIMVEGYDQRDPAAYVTPEPMTKLSYKSRLIDLASSGKHHDVKVDPENLRRLILWVDAMCPYRGSEEVRALPDPDFQGIDWLAVRPLVKSAPNIVRPGPLLDTP